MIDQILSLVETCKVYVSSVCMMKKMAFCLVKNQNTDFIMTGSMCCSGLPCRSSSYQLVDFVL